MSGRPTVLEALQAAIGLPLAPVSAVALADDLTGHLLPGIVTRVARGGRFAPLAAQLNHDRLTCGVSGCRDVLGRLGDKVLGSAGLAGHGQAAGP